MTPPGPKCKMQNVNCNVLVDAQIEEHGKVVDAIDGTEVEEFVGVEGNVLNRWLVKRPLFVKTHP